MLTDDELEQSALSALKAIVDVPVFDAMEPGPQIQAAELLLEYVRHHRGQDARLTALEKEGLEIKNRMEAISE